MLTQGKKQRQTFSLGNIAVSVISLFCILVFLITPVTAIEKTTNEKEATLSLFPGSSIAAVCATRPYSLPSDAPESVSRPELPASKFPIDN